MATLNLISIVLLVVGIVITSVSTYYIAKWENFKDSNEFNVLKNVLYITSIIMFVILSRFFIMFSSLTCDAFEA